MVSSLWYDHQTRHRRLKGRSRDVSFRQDERMAPRHIVIALAAVWLVAAVTACAALERADTPATLAAQNVSFATEIAALDSAATQEDADAAVRVAELATNAARVNGINAQLVGTLQLVVTPTPQLVGSAFDPSQPPNPDDVSQRLYVNTGVSTEIRSSDGCVVNPREQFSPFEQRLYATFAAFNLRAGTLFRVEWWWTTTQQLMFSDSWTADGDYDELCIWFYVTQDDVVFEPGSWQARLFVDEAQMTSPQRFEIVPGM
jgi:hypothetical protein